MDTNKKLLEINNKIDNLKMNYLNWNEKNLNLKLI